MTPDERDRLSKLEVEVTIMKDTLGDIRKDTREVRDVVLNAKGGWKTLVVVGGIAGTIGAIFGKLASILHIPT